MQIPRHCILNTLYIVYQCTVYIVHNYFILYICVHCISLYIVYHCTLNVIDQEGITLYSEHSREEYKMYIDYGRMTYIPCTIQLVLLCKVYIIYNICTI